MLELHVWGPAFGLPSIDVECLAAIQYLHGALPKRSWSLVPSSNPRLNPFRQLPALLDDSTWVAGFEQIQRYLCEISNGAWDINHDLNEAQVAACDAYKTFIRSKGFPLLDLNFYVSSENYKTCTRSALAEITTWPQSWIVPHQLRERAKRRSEHLGMSALDVDAAQEQESEAEGLTAQIPKSLRKPKQTVSGLLGYSVQKARFRLEAITDDFFEPLALQLKGKKWLVADHMSSVDCLLSAVFSLMQVPNLPQPWLRESLTTRFTILSEWALVHCLPVTNQETIASLSAVDTSMELELPWKAPAPPSWADTGAFAVETIVSSIPILRLGYETNEISDDTTLSKKRPRQKQEVYAKVRDQQAFYSQAVMAGVGTASAIGWMIRVGLIVIPHFRKAPPVRRNFGEAGALLGL